MNDVICIFAFIGLGCVGGIIFFLLLMLRDLIKDQIAMAKYRHKRKHRFDGPPTAKCYCKDCVYYYSNTGNCTQLRRGVPDNGYCYEGYPCKHDPDKNTDK